MYRQPEPTIVLEKENKDPKTKAYLRKPQKSKKWKRSFFTYQMGHFIWFGNHFGSNRNFLVFDVSRESNHLNHYPNYYVNADPRGTMTATATQNRDRTGTGPGPNWDREHEPGSNRDPNLYIHVCTETT